MNRLITAIFLFTIVFDAFGHTQTIAPVVAECGRKCRGTFNVKNNGIDPMAVLVEARSFEVVNGKQVFKPLAATITLSEKSARIGPRGDRDFDYKVHCDQTPCAIEFDVSMILGHTVEGLQIRGVLPHVVYSCDRSKDCRKQTLMAGGVPVR